MTKETSSAMTTIEAYTDDPTVQEAKRRRDDLQRRLADADARGARRWGVPDPETKQKREAREEAEELRPALAQAERDLAVAEASARQRITALRRPGYEEILRRQLPALEAVRDLAREERSYLGETAARCGLVATMILSPTLDDAISRIARALNPPVEPPAPPPRPGEVRVRLAIDSLHHRERLQWYFKGDVFDLAERDARDLLKRGAVVEVEVGV